MRRHELRKLVLKSANARAATVGLEAAETPRIRRLRRNRSRKFCTIPIPAALCLSTLQNRSSGLGRVIRPAPKGRCAGQPAGRGRGWLPWRPRGCARRQWESLWTVLFPTCEPERGRRAGGIARAIPCENRNLVGTYVSVPRSTLQPSSLHESRRLKGEPTSHVPGFGIRIRFLSNSTCAKGTCPLLRARAREDS